MDYLERAKRQVALPKIDKHIGEEEIKIRELWEKMEDERIMKMREEWTSSRETKERLSSMSTDAEDFKNVLKVKQKHWTFFCGPFFRWTQNFCNATLLGYWRYRNNFFYMW